MAISLEKAVAGFKSFGRAYPRAIVAGMRAGLLIGMRAAKLEYILSQSGPPIRRRLTSRSGALRGSVRIIEPRQKGAGHFEGGLMAGSSAVPYARIHELGGITRPHVILPKRAKYLSWIDKSTGKRVFRRRVFHPGSRMPKRPYLVPGLHAGWPQIQKQVAVAIEVAAAKALR